MPPPTMRTRAACMPCLRVRPGDLGLLAVAALRLPAADSHDVHPVRAGGERAHDLGIDAHQVPIGAARSPRRRAVPHRSRRPPGRPPPARGGGGRPARGSRAPSASGSRRCRGRPSARGRIDPRAPRRGPPASSWTSIRFRCACLDMAASFPRWPPVLNAQTVRATPGGGTMDGPRAGRLLALALLELALDAVQLRRGPVQPPPVAHQRDRRRKGDPDRPEGALGAGRRPDRRAQQEGAEQAAGLLEQPPLQCC